MAKKVIPEENVNADPSEDDAEFPFVQVARPDIGTTWDVIKRVGPSIIGGDFTGNARGNGAIDIQIRRSDPEDVAAGEDSIIFGTYARASADRSTAIGPYAATDLPDTINLSGLLILKANYSNPLAYICERGAAEIVLATDVVDLTQIATYTITLPWAPGHSCQFFVDECILVATHMPSRTFAAPSVMFGIPTDPDCLVPPTSCTHIWRDQRYERFAITWDNGHAALCASITGGATIPEGETMRGRFIFKGLLIEDEGDGV